MLLPGVSFWRKEKINSFSLTKYGWLMTQAFRKSHLWVCLILWERPLLYTCYIFRNGNYAFHENNGHIWFLTRYLQLTVLFLCEPKRFPSLIANIKEILQPFISDFLLLNFLMVIPSLITSLESLSLMQKLMIFFVEAKTKCQRRLNERKSLCVTGSHSCYNGDIVPDSSV